MKEKNKPSISRRRPVRRVIVVLICLAVFLVGIGSASPVLRDCPGGGGGGDPGGGLHGGKADH